MNIGLFFGSFNPIHIGHLAIANYIIEFTESDRVWFVISPHNPLKDKATLLADHHRYQMVHRAIEDHPIYVYPRAGVGNESKVESSKIKIVDAPIMEISSSFIRQAIKSGKDIRYFL